MRWEHVGPQRDARIGCNIWAVALLLLCLSGLWFSSEMLALFSPCDKWLCASKITCVYCSVLYVNACVLIVQSVHVTYHSFKCLSDVLNQNMLVLPLKKQLQGPSSKKAGISCWFCWWKAGCWLSASNSLEVVKLLSYSSPFFLNLF